MLCSKGLKAYVMQLISFHFSTNSKEFLTYSNATFNITKIITISSKTL